MGVAQCIYIIVYMVFRADKLKNASVPFMYFFVMGAAFFLDFARRFLSEISHHYEIWGLALWFAGPPLSVLVIMQMVKGGANETLRHYYWVLLLPVLAFLGAYGLAFLSADCDAQQEAVTHCADFRLWLVLCNILAGGAGLLVLWAKKDLFRNVRSQKYGRERYWLTLTIVINNIFFLALMFSYFNTEITAGEIARIRTLLGLVFIYLVTTSLFRVYPQTLFKDSASSPLNAADQALADKITGLLEYEKIYHESGYSRSDLAKELGVSEYQASNVINAHFGKSLPQLLNEYRVEDAKRLLEETGADVKVIAEETGFNSIATFNRVFRDITGHTPSAYRKNFVKK